MKNGGRTDRIITRIEPELVRTLEKIAKRERRSLSDVIRLFLNFAAKQHRRAGSYEALCKATLAPMRKSPARGCK